MQHPRAPSDATVGLYNKYENIQQGINQTLQKRETVEAETSKINEAIHQFQQDNVRLQHDTVQAHQEATTFHTKVDQANTEYTLVEQEHSQASLAKDRITQKRLCFNQISAESRQAFLEASREFRSNCKRMRLRASVLGLDHASIRAFSVVKGMDGRVYDELDHSMPDLANEDSQDLQGDPDAWYIDRDDQDMKDQIALYNQKKQVFEDAKLNFESFKIRKEAAMEKVVGRENRKEKLQAQVDKIQKESADLEAQIQEQEFLTQETNLMAENYIKNTSKLKRQQSRNNSKVTPSPLARSNAQATSKRPTNTRNPYARSSTSTAAPKAATTKHPSSSNVSELAAARRAELQAVTLGQSFNTASALERQYPHRTGRIRRDRQFGSSLQVTGGETADPMQSWLPPAQTTQQDQFSGDNDETISPGAVQSSFDKVVQALEDDDEDDEALFSY